MFSIRISSKLTIVGKMRIFTGYFNFSCRNDELWGKWEYSLAIFILVVEIMDNNIELSHELQLREFCANEAFSDSKNLAFCKSWMSRKVL